MKFPDRSLTNLQIEGRMKRVPGWLGVFSRDTLPDLSRQKAPWSLVFNLQTSKEAGSHWVAMCRQQGGRYIEYFDSFGAAPPVEAVRAKGRVPLMHSSAQLQDVRSSSCGWYCMDFLRERAKGVPMLEYLYRFNQNFGDPKAGAENERLLHRR